jgi:serine/threonine-protein kinase RsbW
MIQGVEAYECRLTLPASLPAIEAVLQEFRAEAVARLTPADAFAVELLLREALNNAVLHGCGADPTRSVECALRLDGRHLAAVVCDGGAGFNWREALRGSTRTDESSGRGVAILRQYATRVRFNAGGNRVVILKRFVMRRI